MYFDMVRDCYESIVLYMFFALCYCYIGQIDRYNIDTERINAVLVAKGSVDHLPPFGTFWNKIDLTDNPSAFLRKCKKNILQFVVVKPLASSLAIYLHNRGMYVSGDFSINGGYLYICLCVNFSISLSLYWLVMFYVATREALEPYNPVPKFLCIKGVLFFSFWQSVVIVILNKMGFISKITNEDVDSEQMCSVIQNSLICLEMTAAAVAHSYAFQPTPFELLVRPAVTARRILTNAFDLNDVVRDFNEVSPLIIPSTTFKQVAPVLQARASIPIPSEEALQRLVDK